MSFAGGPLLFRRPVPAEHLRPVPVRPRVDPEVGHFTEDTPAGGNMFAVRARMKSRRRYGRRRRGRRRGIIRRRLPRALAPARKVVRLKCVFESTLTCTSGALAYNAFKMFDITDPMGASSAFQPLGYDQWKTLYNKGVVIGVKVTSRVHNKGTAGVMFGLTAMPENQSSTGLTLLNHYMELPQTKSRLLSPDVDHGIVSLRVNTGRHVAVKKLLDEDAFHVDLDGEVAPTRDAWFHLWVQPIDKATTNSVEQVTTLEYLILLFDPIVPARSADT